MTLLLPRAGVRKFGHIPGNVFGVIDPLLPEMIGRIVMLAALLEHKVACIAASVENEPQDLYFAQNFSQNLDVWKLRSPLSSLNESENRIVERCGRFIAKVELVLKERHDIVHRVWPVARA